MNTPNESKAVACPDAPKRGGGGGHQPFWVKIRNNSLVREKLKQYTPADIRELEDRETLEVLFGRFRWMNTQLMNSVEEYWVELLMMCIWARLRQLPE